MSATPPWAPADGPIPMAWHGSGMTQGFMTSAFTLRAGLLYVAPSIALHSSPICVMAVRQQCMVQSFGSVFRPLSASGAEAKVLGRKSFGTFARASWHRHAACLCRPPALEGAEPGMLLVLSVAAGFLLVTSQSLLVGAGRERFQGAAGLGCRGGRRTADKAEWGCDPVGSRVVQTNIFAQGVKQTPIFRLATFGPHPECPPRSARFARWGRIDPRPRAGGPGSPATRSAHTHRHRIQCYS